MVQNNSRKSSSRKIVLERIEILFEQAYLNRSDQVLANRYVSLAREIAMRQRQRISRRFRRSFCPVCRTYIIPGKNSRVRVQHGKVISTCKVCGAIARYPLCQTRQR
ncbi:MAG: ribonuclease P [Methanocalculaceae archaeon]|nr:ribonuclease P [Methanocalculaceae archaeon]